MKASAFCFLSITLVSLALNTACGSKSDDSEAAATPTSTYTYVANTKAIIDANCATSGCHAAGTTVTKPLSTLAEVKALASKMSTRIQADDSSRMPADKPAFEASADGVMLLDWLAGGADLK